MIAALYVERDGPYWNDPRVDPWDEQRDARLYPGPYPVIAHPPCQRWCQLASVNEARWGTPIGEDHGTFAAALAAVRRYGGILEHPAYSLAWERYDLPRPIRGGWAGSLTDPGISTEISQVVYGHAARKRTWLYMIGIEPFELDWTERPGTAVIGAGIRSGQSVGRDKIQPGASNPTPELLKEILIAAVQKATVPA